IIVHPAHHVFHLTLRGYLGRLYLAMRSAPTETELALWTLIGLVAVKRLGFTDRSAQLLCVAAVSLTARFFVFPFAQNRYFLWTYLIAGIALARTLRLDTVQSGTGNAPA
ncbi:MAG: hypothetical protein WAL85_12525, partial [Candidatus Korobacteraceae bacterium]